MKMKMKQQALNEVKNMKEKFCHNYERKCNFCPCAIPITLDGKRCAFELIENAIIKEEDY